MAIELDLTTYPLDDLSDLAQRIQQEIDSRTAKQEVIGQIDRLNQTYLNVDGREPGSEWAQPTGAHDAYPLGWVVAHDGKTWESLVAVNVFEPGNPDDPQSYRWWRDISTVPEDGEWDGNGHAYAVGDRVTFEGVLYECRQSHTSQPGWTPVMVPALWQAV